MGRGASQGYLGSDVEYPAHRIEGRFRNCFG
jgi:hypothetical protein